MGNYLQFYITKEFTLLAVIYSNIETQVCWNGINSDKFIITNFVKQGEVMSLISRIVGSSIVCHVGNILMSADDIALAMQHL